MSAQLDIENELFKGEFRESFWPAYPRKVGKVEAEKAYLKARRGDKRNGICSRSQAAIMDALASYKLETSSTKIEYVLHAASWLNKRRDADVDLLRPEKPQAVNTHPSWNGSREILERQIQPKDFGGYFALLEFRAGPPPVIVCPTQFMADHVARKFQFPLIRAFGESLKVIAEKAS